jgi:hypothetical protein
MLYMFYISYSLRIDDIWKSTNKILQYGLRSYSGYWKFISLYWPLQNLNIAWISIFAFSFKNALKSKVHVCLNVVVNFWFIKTKLHIKIKLQNFKIGIPVKKKVKVSHNRPRWVTGRLRPRIFLAFGITKVVGRQPYAPVAFTPGEIPGTHF